MIICVPLGFLSYWVASIMNRKDYELLPGVRDQIEEFGSDSLVRVGHDGPGASAVAPPRPGLIMFLIAAPIVQILLGTAGTLLINKKNYWYGVASFVGNPFFASLVAVALAFFLLAVRRQLVAQGNRRDLRRRVASHRIDPDGGSCRRRVRRRPAGLRHRRGTVPDAGLPGRADHPARLHHLPGHCAPPRVRPRYAIVTTTGLLSAAVAQGGYTPAQIAVIVIAIGFGGLGLSHVTDAGFWAVVRYYGLTVSDGLKTWTVLTTILGIRRLPAQLRRLDPGGRPGPPMRVRLDDLVGSALERGAAVPAFTCYDFTTALAVVVRQPRSHGRGVILLVAPKTAAHSAAACGSSPPCAPWPTTPVCRSRSSWTTPRPGRHP